MLRVQFELSRQMHVIKWTLLLVAVIVPILAIVALVFLGGRARHRRGRRRRRRTRIAVLTHQQPTECSVNTMSTKPSMNWLRRLPRSGKYFLAVGITVVAVVCGVGTVWSTGAFSSADTPSSADPFACPLRGEHHKGGAGYCTDGTDDSDTDEYADVPETAAAPDPTEKDFIIDTKVVRKHCFGSAGCNVNVEPVIDMEDVDLEIPEDGCDITVQVTGGESGPTVDTLEIADDGKYSFEEMSLHAVQFHAEPCDHRGC